MLDLDSMQALPARPSASGLRAIEALVWRWWRRAGVEVALEGWDGLPQGPVIFAMNHSHKYDFLMFRVPMQRRGRPAQTWVKARAWNDLGMRWFLGRHGNLPLLSRGYILASDFQAVHGRRPQEAEYRTMRDALDQGSPLPEGPLWDALRQRRRAILGLPYAPSRQSWQGAIAQVYQQAMEHTLERSRQAIAQGSSLHIYPQGTVTSRLTRGRSGAVQAAAALGLPLVPVGCSGVRRAMPGKGLGFAPGRVVLRFGAPLYVRAFQVSGEQQPRPFVPGWEARHRALLERETRRLMLAINDLLEPEYQGGDHITSDGTRGVARFF